MTNKIFRQRPRYVDFNINVSTKKYFLVFTCMTHVLSYLNKEANTEFLNNKYQEL